jgi:AraC-like DNA-binding protein
MHALEESARSGAYTKLLPRRALAPFVRHIRVVPPSEYVTPYFRFPDGQLELVLRRGMNDEWFNVVGTRSQALHKDSGAGGRWCVVVRFKAGGAYPFFGMPASALTDQIVPLDELWKPGSSDLRRAFDDAREPADCVVAAEDALCRRLFGPDLYEPASAILVRSALRKLDATQTLPSVEELAHELGTSLRQLRRAFGDVVGVAPKLYLRILRFQRARREAEASPEPRWGAIAVAHGYFDQAHLIADFRALSGQTPAALHRASRERGS